MLIAAISEHMHGHGYHLPTFMNLIDELIWKWQIIFDENLLSLKIDKMTKFLCNEIWSYTVFITIAKKTKILPHKATKQLSQFEFK